MHFNKFTPAQQARIANWYKCISALPQVPGPLWLLKALDRALPTACPFERAIWRKGQLVCYVPSLCQLNPFYESLFEYRMRCLEEADAFCEEQLSLLHGGKDIARAT